MLIPKDDESKQLTSMFNELLPEQMRRYDRGEVSYVFVNFLEVVIWKLQEVVGKDKGKLL